MLLFTLRSHKWSIQFFTNQACNVIVIHCKKKQKTTKIYFCLMLLCSFFRRIKETKINQLEMNEDVVMRDLSFSCQGVTGSCCCEDLRLTSPRISYSLTVKWVRWFCCGWNSYTDLGLYNNWRESSCGAFQLWYRPLLVEAPHYTPFYTMSHSFNNVFYPCMLFIWWFKAETKTLVSSSKTF